MNELIKVSVVKIGENSVKSVSARDLHEKLKVGRDFSTWIKGRIQKYSFVEYEDYILTVPQNGGAGKMGLFDGSDKIEYFITLDMAKELAMIENNPIGRNIRKYFIELEKRYFQKLEESETKQVQEKSKVEELREIREVTSELIQLANLFGFSGNQAYLSADKVTKQITGTSPLELLDKKHLVSESKSKILTPTEIGKIIGKTAIQVNKILESKGFQKKIDKVWHLTEQGEKYAEMLDTNKKHSDGTPVKQIKWKSEITHFIKE
jgi:phage anti-repressor protein